MQAIFREKDQVHKDPTGDLLSYFLGTLSGLARFPE